MLSTELMASLHKLSRSDKLRAVQILVNDLASEEAAMLEGITAAEVWSPFDAPKAVQTLQLMLDEEKARNG
jgi:hypothetical protein